MFSLKKHYMKRQKEVRTMEDLHNKNSLSASESSDRTMGFQEKTPTTHYETSPQPDSYSYSPSDSEMISPDERDRLHDIGIEKELGRSLGCMAGLFHMFDKSTFLTSKRLFGFKSRTRKKSIASSSQCSTPARDDENLAGDYIDGRNSIDTSEAIFSSGGSPARSLPSPGPTPPSEKNKRRIIHPIHSLPREPATKKYPIEFPRHSLDSALQTPRSSSNIYDAETCASPSVVARLMGLDHPIPMSPSRGSVSERGKNSPGVVAKLMGLPEYDGQDQNETLKTKPSTSQYCETCSVSSEQDNYSARSVFSAEEFIPSPIVSISSPGASPLTIRTSYPNSPLKEVGSSPSSPKRKKMVSEQWQVYAPSKEGSPPTSPRSRSLDRRPDHRRTRSRSQSPERPAARDIENWRQRLHAVQIKAHERLQRQQAIFLQRDKQQAPASPRLFTEVADFLRRSKLEKSSEDGKVRKSRDKVSSFDKPTSNGGEGCRSKRSYDSSMRDKSVSTSDKEKCVGGSDKVSLGTSSRVSRSQTPPRSPRQNQQAKVEGDKNNAKKDNQKKENGPSKVSSSSKSSGKNVEKVKSVRSQVKESNKISQVDDCEAEETKVKGTAHEDDDSSLSNMTDIFEASSSASIEETHEKERKEVEKTFELQMRKMLDKVLPREEIEEKNETEKQIAGKETISVDDSEELGKESMQKEVAEVEENSQSKDLKNHENPKDKKEDSQNVQFNMDLINYDIYIEEILKESGFMDNEDEVVFLSDGNVIDPNIFNVLEEKHDTDQEMRSYRKLVFQVVNDILCSKFTECIKHSWSLTNNKIRPIRPYSTRLLEYVKNEFEKLQVDCPEYYEDVMVERDINKTTFQWFDYTTDAISLVVELEKMIFADLVSEVVAM